MSVRPNPSHAVPGGPVVMFRLAGYQFLIASAEVEEIRDLHSASLPAAIAARGSGRQIPVIAADQVFGLPPAKLEQLLVLKVHRVAVAIGRIEGMAELREIVALPPAFHGQERSWYRGLGMVRQQIMPVVNAGVFAERAGALSPEAAATAERAQPNAGT